MSLGRVYGLDYQLRPRYTTVDQPQPEQARFPDPGIPVSGGAALL